MNLKKTIKRKLVDCILSLMQQQIRPMDQILFVSFHGHQYSDNPRAISEKMHEMHPEIKIAWYLDSSVSVDIPDYVRIVRPISKFTLTREILKSFCFVTNYDLGRDTRKNDSQIFIQTWHGDIGLKKVLYEAWDDGNRPEPVYDEYLTDYCIAGSRQGEQQYRNAFHFRGKILRCGSPRNDVLVNKDKARMTAVREKYGLKETDRLLLYAPTFRDNKTGKQEVGVNLKRAVEILNAKSKKDNWVCLLRAHIASAGLNYKVDSKTIIDVSDYADMADLLASVDILITDYSSCAGDFLLTRRPTILAFFDKEDYLRSCRNFQFDPYEAGFWIAGNQTELEKILTEKNWADAEDNCNKLIRHFEIVDDGYASERVCKIIFEHYQKLGFSKRN